MELLNQLKGITDELLSNNQEDYVQFAITVLIEWRNYQAALRSGDVIDYLAKNLKRHLRDNGLETTSLWFSLELTDSSGHISKPHIHGSITLNKKYHQQLCDALLGALGKPKVKSAARKRTVREIYSSGWVDYCFKDVSKTRKAIGRRPVFVARGVAKFFGKNESSENAVSPDTARLSSVSGRDCLVRYINTPKITSNPVQKKMSRTYPITIQDLLRERVRSTPPPKAEVSEANNLIM